MSNFALPIGLPTNSRVFAPFRSAPGATSKEKPAGGLTSVFLQYTQELFALASRADDYDVDTSSKSVTTEWAAPTAPTSLSITRLVDATLQVRLAKSFLLAQLSAHSEEPVTYDMGDDSIAVEFYKNKSNLVCVFDKYGIQLLWVGANGTPNSQVIGNDLFFEASISSRIESILRLSPT